MSELPQVSPEADARALIPARPEEIQLVMNASLPEQIEVDIDPVVIKLSIPSEWFASNVRSSSTSN